MSIANYLENQLLDAVFNNDSFSVGSTFIQLHIGDPGENCTNNVAAHTTRVASSWGAAVSGQVLNDAIVTFSPMAATETISWISVWDTLSGGNPLWYGPLSTPQDVNSGGSLSFQPSSITVTLN